MRKRLELPPTKVLLFISSLLVGFLAVEYFLIAFAYQNPSSWFDPAFWAILVFISKRTQVKLPFSAGMSHLFVIALASSIALPLWMAPLLVFIFSFDIDTGKPSFPWFKDLFNRTQQAIATGISGLVWNLTTTHGQIIPGSIGIYLNEGIGIMLASIAFLFINISAVTYVIHLATGATLRKVWFGNFSWLWKSSLILAPVGLLLARAYTTPLIGGWGGFTVLFLMLLLYFSRFYWEEKVKLEEAFDNTIEVLVQTIDAKDPFTRRHSERVAAITAHMAKRMGFDDSDIKRITYASRIHDIGKVAIPDAVLLKPAKLDRGEFEVVKTHARRGVELLKPMLPFLAKGVKEVILHHHERWDGTGYPTQQQTTKIHPWARIVALADAYEAMTAGRSYAQAKSPEVALGEIMGLAGKQFDPEVVKIFEQVWLEDPLWKDREVFLRAYSSPVPSLELPSPYSPEPVSATLPTSN
ncbi:MAG: HD-GYP domain-containing protein [Thermaceae bacterium]|nr:HD-GYP domain-containing protein [Thermaceae bacterium]